MKLSIIIPCYNAEPYINELLDRLAPQMTDDVEVLVIDDGSKKPFTTSHKFVKVIRQTNGGASSARNKGIDLAKGEYIAFIDADDLISKDYLCKVKEILQKEEPDFVYLSWKTLPGGWAYEVILKSVQDEFPPFNLCVWNRIYKKDLIGKVRFNEKKLIAEDAEFIRDVETQGKKKAFIGEPIYYYRSDTPDSLTKRFAKGEVMTQRIVYNLPSITKDMKALVKEVKELDKEAEVIIMTMHNDLPELKRYAMVIQPQLIKGTELRGEPTSLFQKITLPIKTQVVIYTSKTFMIGGIETWIYNFCERMKEYYDILVLYDSIDTEQLDRLTRIVRTKHNDGTKIECDTVIVNRISDPIPANVTYKQSVQMIHSLKLVESWEVPKGRDKYIAVSNAVKKSFGCGEVIHNMTISEEPRQTLMLISATRLSTFEKGQKRMTDFAKGLEYNGIPYIWLVFSDKQPSEMTKDMVWMPPRIDIKPYIARADYLVQLSDQEGFCYSIVESWEAGTPVITTPIDVLKEIGFVEGVNGYTVPFDMKNIDYDRLLNIPRMMPQPFDNKKQIEKWKKVLGNTQPKRDYKPEARVIIEALRTYRDTVLGRTIEQGERVTVPQYRAEKIVENGLGRIYGKV